jgi:hypothetical protein
VAWLTSDPYNSTVRSRFPSCVDNFVSVRDTTINLSILIKYSIAVHLRLLRCVLHCERSSQPSLRVESFCKGIHLKDESKSSSPVGVS